MGLLGGALRTPDHGYGRRGLPEPRQTGRLGRAALEPYSAATGTPRKASQT